MRKRLNPIEILLVVILLSPALIFVCRAEEQITITTYYPAPNGIYREMRVNQMSVGSTYRTSLLGDGNIIISGRAGIGSNNTPSGKLDAVMANGVSRVTINDDNNAGISLRGVGGSPYIDFFNDLGGPYDVRLSLTGDNTLMLDGGTIILNATSARTYDWLNNYPPNFQTKRYRNKEDEGCCPGPTCITACLAAGEYVPAEIIPGYIP